MFYCIYIWYIVFLVTLVFESVSVVFLVTLVFNSIYIYLNLSFQVHLSIIIRSTMDTSGINSYIHLMKYWVFIMLLVNLEVSWGMWIGGISLSAFSTFCNPWCRLTLPYILNMNGINILLCVNVRYFLVSDFQSGMNTETLSTFSGCCNTDFKVFLDVVIQK